MTEQPTKALVEGEVTLVYKLRATNTEEEDNGPLASHARRVLNVEVLVDAVNEKKADVFFYDELADAAARLDIERGARLWLEASPAWLRPAGDHPRMAADPLFERRRAGSVALAPRDLLLAAQTPDALRAWRCCCGDPRCCCLLVLAPASALFAIILALRFAFSVLGAVFLELQQFLFRCLPPSAFGVVCIQHKSSGPRPSFGSGPAACAPAAPLLRLLSPLLGM